MNTVADGDQLPGMCASSPLSMDAQPAMTAGRVKNIGTQGCEGGSLFLQPVTDTKRQSRIERLLFELFEKLFVAV